MTTLLNKAIWYRRRLASMSTAEVFHRLDEAIKRRLDQFSIAPNTKDLGSFKPLPYVRDRLDEADLSPETLASWEKTFQQAQAGELFLLNQNWPARATDELWHLDPVTQKLWPRDTYGSDIDYRHNTAMGDVKYVWEANRLQYLQPIAALAYKKADPQMARFCLQQIESWINSNSPYRGINWVSGIELALRAISILTVITLTGKYLTSQQRSKIWGTVQAHGNWLARYPSKHSSANNHRTAEGLGLFVLGSLCPQLEAAEEWRTQGWSILCESADSQILPDGVSAEQAVSYGNIVLEMLHIGEQIAINAGLDIPDNYHQQMRRGEEFINCITDKGGNYPHIGDDDNGFVIDPGLRQIFLNAPSPAPIPNGAKCFEAGGYTVGRHHINQHDLLVVFDHGDLGYLSIAAHGHADALSIWLHIDDQPVFVDAGTYLYHSGGAERDAFRGTAAHNTLCLEETNSSTIAGPFNWSHKAQCKVITSQLNDDNWYVEAEHDGYVRKFNTIHRRKVSFDMQQGITIRDSLNSVKEHTVEIGYLLHPALSAQFEDKTITTKKDDRTLLRLTYDGPLNAEIRTDADYSPSFGVKQSTTRIVFSGTLAPHQTSTLHCLPVE